MEIAIIFQKTYSSYQLLKLLDGMPVQRNYAYSAVHSHLFSLRLVFSSIPEFNEYCIELGKQLVNGCKDAFANCLCHIIKHDRGAIMLVGEEELVSQAANDLTFEKHESQPFEMFTAKSSNQRT